MGISSATLQRWESNRTEPLVYMLPRIIEFLGFVPYSVPKSFGEWVLMVRRSWGLSRRRLSSQLGVDPSTLARWERDTAYPSLRLRELAEDFFRVGEPPSQ